MRFGRCPVDDALGSILAHTLRLGEAGVIKKGKRLGEREVDALRSAGHADVMVAHLEDADIAEDEAAARVAGAALGRSVRLAAAATGRCNLHAATDGLVRVDVARVAAINAVDESLTLATLVPDTPVREGDLIATVKVIPYAVPRPLVEACEAAAGGGVARGVVEVAPFGGFRAGLILTRLAGVHESVLDRAAASQRVRAERLGGRILVELRCPHEEEAVASAIVRLLAEGCSPVLVLGASAIADRRDVIPAAVERAGGRLRHFGMPVDPGNLLLLAHHGEVPVLGVPGCARSLKRSGFDMVLERIAAGLPVDRAQIAAMGVGGLLVEGPVHPPPHKAPGERPQAEEAAAPRVAAVVLAAGHSRRMGERNKLLIPVDGTPMVARVVEALLATATRPVVVVTGHDAEAVRGALAEVCARFPSAVRFADNPEHQSGMASSLRVGVEALCRLPEADADAIEGALVCLGDMPRLAPAHIEALLDAFDPGWPPPGGAPPDRGGRRPLCVPVFEGRRGNPVLFARRYFDELRALAGDVGAKALLERHADAVRRVPVGDDGVLLDVDTPETLLLITRNEE